MADRPVALHIEALGAGGDGIATLHGRPVYIPLTLPGEAIRADVDGERGRLLDVLSPSDRRVEPDCVHFGACGGCAVQHLEASAYRTWKRDLVVTALARRGIDADVVGDLIPAQPENRRRAVFEVRRTRDDVVAGFHERRSHRIVAVPHCRVLRQRVLAGVEALSDALAGIMLPGDHAIVAINDTETGLDVLVAGRPALDLHGREELATLASASPITRLTWSVNGAAETVFEVQRPEVRFGTARVCPPPGAFLQATADGEAALVEAVRAFAGPDGPILDLFAGCGTFTFPLAEGATVHAVDSEAPAIAALEKAAREAGIWSQRVTAAVRDLGRRPLGPRELDGHAAVVFDPPRAGARAQAELLAGSAVKRVVAVSCNPATFARDARILLDGGYRLEAVRPVDQFLWSPHVELVACFVR